MEIEEQQRGKRHLHPLPWHRGSLKWCPHGSLGSATCCRLTTCPLMPGAPLTLSLCHCCFLPVPRWAWTGCCRQQTLQLLPRWHLWQERSWQRGWVHKPAQTRLSALLSRLPCSAILSSPTGGTRALWSPTSEQKSCSCLHHAFPGATASLALELSLRGQLAASLQSGTRPALSRSAFGSD